MNADRQMRGVVGLALLVAACSASPTEVGSTALLTVSPAAGAVSVDLSHPIEVRFDHTVESSGAHPIALHVGDCPGPIVMGTWSPTPEGRGLRFTPMQALEPMTDYSIHLGGHMTDAGGTMVDLERHGPALGGTWVTRDMVMGMNGMGMGQPHSGAEWLHPNGMYGLAFAFTTGM